MFTTLGKNICLQEEILFVRVCVRVCLAVPPMSQKRRVAAPAFQNTVETSGIQPAPSDPVSGELRICARETFLEAQVVIMLHRLAWEWLETPQDGRYCCLVEEILKFCKILVS